MQLAAGRQGARVAADLARLTPTARFSEKWTVRIWGDNRGEMGLLCRAALAISVAAFGWGPPRTAAACSSVSPGFELITPAPGRPAPINTRIRVSYVQSWQIPVTVMLTDADGRQVPARTQIAMSGEVRVVELVPASDLEPGTRYEVRTVEAGPSPVETVVGSFVTGNARDTASPKWGGVRRAGIVRQSAGGRRGARHGRRGSAVGSGCQRARPYAVLVPRAAVDRDTPAPSILYAVWLPGEHGRLNTASEPAAFVAAENGRIVLGSENSCDPRQFAFPSRGALRVGVAAVDPAGNLSAPVVLGLRPVRAARLRTE